VGREGPPLLFEVAIGFGAFADAPWLASNVKIGEKRVSEHIKEQL